MTEPCFEWVFLRERIYAELTRMNMSSPPREKCDRSVRRVFVQVRTRYSYIMGKISILFFSIPLHCTLQVRWSTEHHRWLRNKDKNSHSRARKNEMICMGLCNMLRISVGMVMKIFCTACNFTNSKILIHWLRDTCFSNDTIPKIEVMKFLYFLASAPWFAPWT